jgi:anti-sigma regulatory factor (Ser/Thr protein kinase)
LNASPFGHVSGIAPRLLRVAAAQAASIPALRADLIAYLRRVGIEDEGLRWCVALAVTEACGNVVRHAYDGPRGSITLTAEVRSGTLVVEVADEGRGTATPSSDPGLGLGLALMRATAQDVAIDSGPAGTTVRLTFPAR